MARRIVAVTTITPTGIGDASNLVDVEYPFVLQGGSTTQEVYIWEVSITGQAAAGAVTIMLLSRDSQVAATAGSNITGFTDAAKDPATAALAAPPLTGDAWTTKPQRSATLHMENCSLNAFGGVYLWRANRVEECTKVLGNTASFGEVSLSAFTGGSPGPIGTHLIYEPL